MNLMYGHMCQCRHIKWAHTHVTCTRITVENKNCCRCSVIPSPLCVVRPVGHIEEDEGKREEGPRPLVDLDGQDAFGHVE